VGGSLRQAGGHMFFYQRERGSRNVCDLA